MPVNSRDNQKKGIILKIAIEKNNVVRLGILAVVGIAAGFINGFLGAGGGIILLSMFRRLNPNKNSEGARDDFASVVAAVLPLCVVSAINYSSRGSLDMNLFLRFIPGALVGGVVGAYLTDKIDTRILKNIFALIIIIAGINMIF